MGNFSGVGAFTTLLNAGDPICVFIGELELESEESGVPLGYCMCVDGTWLGMGMGVRWISSVIRLL